MENALKIGYEYKIFFELTVIVFRKMTSDLRIGVCEVEAWTISFGKLNQLEFNLPNMVE